MTNKKNSYWCNENAKEMLKPNKMLEDQKIEKKKKITNIGYNMYYLKFISLSFLKF